MKIVCCIRILPQLGSFVILTHISIEPLENVVKSHYYCEMHGSRHWLGAKNQLKCTQPKLVMAAFFSFKPRFIGVLTLLLCDLSEINW